ncbi:SgcJ/EcaC family oxidoreductase [Sphingomonas glacialis]|nr:SgcJ/EcaC family oxidoreductase [Sphingomonas glacialis]
MATLLAGASGAPYAAPDTETRRMLSQDDLTAIKAMVPAMEAAWRTHDAAAYAGQFVPDAEHVNAYGMWWRGRAEVEQGIAFALSRIYPDNPIVASDASVSAVGANVAILQYRWRLKPYSDPDGTHYADPQGRVTDVVVRTDAGWRIRNFQSTFINPNVPQPR